MMRMMSAWQGLGGLVSESPQGTVVSFWKVPACGWCLAGPQPARMGGCLGHVLCCEPGRPGREGAGKVCFCGHTLTHAQSPSRRDSAPNGWSDRILQILGFSSFPSSSDYVTILDLFTHVRVERRLGSFQVGAKIIILPIIVFCLFVCF
uniref:Uncharacterized protein n=1 Tax=Myotis myotis TaxID=51298 RepID=A0A7J8ANI1_MYOMY|nr:hypothetical protein mMyoMyo1_008221 [Myotis myotis]